MDDGDASLCPARDGKRAFAVDSDAHDEVHSAENSPAAKNKKTEVDESGNVAKEHPLSSTVSEEAEDLNGEECDSDIVSVTGSSCHSSELASTQDEEESSEHPEHKSSDLPEDSVTITTAMSSTAIKSGNESNDVNATAPPKFVFGSAAKTTVSFTALASAKPAFDFAQDAKDDDSSFLQKADTKIAPVKVETGEEDEKCLFSCRAKLYALAPTDDGREWLEKGLGNVRINEDVATEGRRILMRADGVLRVMLNVRLFEGMRFEPIMPKSVRFSALVENHTEHYLLRFKSTEDLLTFVECVTEYCEAESR